MKPWFGRALKFTERAMHVLLMTVICGCCIFVIYVAGALHPSS